MTYHCYCGAAFTNWPAMKDHFEACDVERVKLDLETFFRTMAWWNDQGELDPEAPATAMRSSIPETWPLIEWGTSRDNVWVRFQMQGKAGVDALVRMQLPAGVFARWRERQRG